MIPGFACGRCGALSTGRDECPDWGMAAWAVPDLLEEMVHRTLEEDGQVTVMRGAPFRIAAKLRFSLAEPGSAVRADRAKHHGTCPQRGS